MEFSFLEAIQLVQATIDRLESVFEFWLTATFAAIAASHFGAERLTRGFAGLLLGLYLIFTVSVGLRLVVWHSALERYSRSVTLHLEAAGSEGSGLTNYISASIWMTVILGTLATAFFIWHSYSSNLEKRR